jgi:uncharacterized protein (TIGR00369 family)
LGQHCNSLTGLFRAFASQEALASGTAAPMVRALGLRVVSTTPSAVTLSMPVVPHVLHTSGLLCGQAIMAAMDFAMALAVIAHADGVYRPMATAQMQTSFLRGVHADAGTVTLVARVLRAGRTLVYGEISLTTPDGKPAAHATATYALV